MPKVTIDGREYELDDLAEDAKSQLANLNLCDQRMQQLQRDLAITQTARNAYAAALKNALPKDG